MSLCQTDQNITSDMFTDKANKNSTFNFLETVLLISSDISTNNTTGVRLRLQFENVLNVT